MLPSMTKGEIVEKLVVIDINPRRSPEASPEPSQLFEEKEHEGHYKCMYKLHGYISLIKPFPTVGGTPCTSSPLRRYSPLKMIM
jgi:hypothetical protein